MGIAIIGVLLSHLIRVGEFDQSNLIIKGLYLTRQLVYTQGFLFLSGFGLYFSLSKNRNLKSFYQRRLFRLFLPYIIMTAPFFVCQVLFRNEPIALLFGRLTTLSFWFEGNFSGMWYVAVSLLLYAIFPFYYHAVFGRIDRTGGGCLWINIICILLIAVGISLMRFIPYYHETIEFGLSQIPAFFIGPFIAWIVDKKPIFKLYHYILVSAAFLFLVCFYLFTSDVDGLSIVRKVITIPLMCIIIDKINFINIVLRWFGKYSLEIYVLHLILLKTPELLPFLSIRALVIVAILFSLVLCMPYSILSKRITDTINK